jgi:hypothetical protein
MLIQIINNACKEIQGFGGVKYLGIGPTIHDIKEVSRGN